MNHVGNSWLSEEYITGKVGCYHFTYNAVSRCNNREHCRVRIRAVGSKSQLRWRVKQLTLR